MVLSRKTKSIENRNEFNLNIKKRKTTITNSNNKKKPKSIHIKGKKLTKVFSNKNLLKQNKNFFLKAA